jgi:uncharacterized membrane protein
MAAATDFDHPFFSARLRPHRSLAPQHARLALVATGMATAVASLPFFLMGAWPVVGFMGLDVLLLGLAFRASYRSARAYEDITVTPLHLHLAKTSARGARTEWRFNPLWVRLEKVEHPEFGLCRLSLASGGRKIEVAGFLGPEAKAEFARALALALAEARRGPRFS